MIFVKAKREDKRLIRKHARSKGMSVSEFMIESAIEAIEDEYDLKLIEEYEARKKRGEVEYCDWEEVRKRIK